MQIVGVRKLAIINNYGEMVMNRYRNEIFHTYCNTNTKTF